MGWLRACGVGTTVGTALQRSFWDDLELCLSLKSKAYILLGIDPKIYIICLMPSSHSSNYTLEPRRPPPTAAHAAMLPSHLW
jgi:hypothetical protein